MEEANNYIKNVSPESELPSPDTDRSTELPSPDTDRSIGTSAAAITPDDSEEFDHAQEEAPPKEVLDSASPMESHSNYNTAFLPESDASTAVLVEPNNATTQPVVESSGVEHVEPNNATAQLIDGPSDGHAFHPVEPNDATPQTVYKPSDGHEVHQAELNDTTAQPIDEPSDGREVHQVEPNDTTAQLIDGPSDGHGIHQVELDNTTAQSVEPSDGNAVHQVECNNATAQPVDRTSDGHEVQRVEPDNTTAQPKDRPSEGHAVHWVKRDNTTAQLVDRAFDGNVVHQVEPNNATAQPVDKPCDGHGVQNGSSVQSTGDSTIPKPPAAPNHRRFASMDQIVSKVQQNYITRTQSAKPSRPMHNIDLSRGQIDTSAPFDSVKAAVSMFGGSVDWKARRVHIVQRRKFIEQELEKVQEELPLYKKQCEAADEAKKQVLEEVDTNKRHIEELQLKIETAQKEEEQVKQAAELAKLQVEEMEQGTSDDASFTAKAQLEVAQEKHAAAVAELNTAKDELEQVKKEYNLLLAEKDEAIRKAKEADTVSKDAEKSIEEMTLELLALKQSLESEYSAHLEAEDHRIEAIMAKELESLSWEKELRWTEEKLEKLNEEMLPTKDVRSKLRKAMALLKQTQAEMAAYMESKSGETGKELTLEDILIEPKNKSHKDIETAITAAKKELAAVGQKIKKATDEAITLEASAAVLKSELDEERSQLADVEQRERTASSALRSLEAELNSIKSEIAPLQSLEMEEKGVSADLPKWLQEAEQAKALARIAHDELGKAKEGAEEAKAEASAMESRLHAAQKEIESAKACEKLALAAINSLAKSKSAQRDLSNEVELPLEEYYELTGRLHKAEERANMRIADDVSQVEAAKESESRSLNRLEEVNCEIAKRKEALQIALQKAKEAEEGKLAVDEELRQWKAEYEQRHKAVESVPEPVGAAESVPAPVVAIQCVPAPLGAVEPVPAPAGAVKSVPAPVGIVEFVPAPPNRSKSLMCSFDVSKTIFGSMSSSSLHRRSTKRTYTRSKTEIDQPPELQPAPRKKKRSFLPRFFTFLFRKKAPASNKIV